MNLTLVPVVFLGLIIFLRWMGSGRRPTITVVQPLNTTCIVISKPNTETKVGEESTGVKNEGGPFVRILHTVNGKWLDDHDPDPMNHKLVKEDGKLGKVEKRDLFYTWFGLQFIWPFRYIRINSIRKHRWGRKDEEKEYSLMAKSDHRLFPDFSGQHDIKLDGVETGKVLSFNMRLNFTLEETFPYRARMRTADAYAQFTIMVSDHVVSTMGEVDPEEFIGGKEKQEKSKSNLKKDLTASFKKLALMEWIEEETGLTIREASLPEFDFDPSTRDLLEAYVRAELTGKAALKAADLGKQAELHRIEADAKRVAEVTILAAKSPETVSVRWAEAYEKNKTLTTLVVGGDGVSPVIPLGK